MGNHKGKVFALECRQNFILRPINVVRPSLNAFLKSQNDIKHFRDEKVDFLKHDENLVFLYKLLAKNVYKKLIFHHVSKN